MQGSGRLRFIFTGRGPFVWIGVVLLSFLGCRETDQAPYYQGYIEAEYLYAASPRGGRLQDLSVERGQEVTAGSPLFRLDPEPERAQRQQAQDKLRQAQAHLDDLQKGLRPSELQSLEAKRQQAEASLTLADREWQRVASLFEDGVATAEDRDRARTTRELYEAQVVQWSAELETGRLGARPDEIQRAQAAASAAQAALAEATWNLSQKEQTCPVHAVVQDTLYRPGEWVAAGLPVVVLLPPERLKVRFFVPQEDLPRVQAGGSVAVSFDGAAAPLAARVRFISTQAEFTPPVIYSRESRQKLSFMVEAAFDTPDPVTLHPGQPVEVRLSP